MDIQYYKEYSNELGRDMEFKSYGWGGIPLLAVPCQNGRFFDWEGFGMLDTLGDYLDQGRIRLFSFDTIDQETVSDVNGNPYDRVRRHEAWYRYVCNELVPRIHEISGWEDRILISGFSMGAYHAGNFMFRRPDIFRGCIALSGLYDTNDMYNGYMDEVVYANDPCAFLSNMPADHPYMEMYRNSDIIICVGQGAWEEQLLAGTRKLDAIVKAKGISAWIDFWGPDVYHDWPWWKIQIRYFLEKMGI